MAYLIDRKAQVLFVSASEVKEKGKRRKIVIESRPEYAVFTLQGMKEQYSICWDKLFEFAKRHHAENLRIEAAAETSDRTRENKLRG